MANTARASLLEAATNEATVLAIPALIAKRVYLPIRSCWYILHSQAFFPRGHTPLVRVYSHQQIKHVVP